MPASVSFAKRFWEKVVRDPETECWEWIGARKPEGYGHFNRGRALGQGRYARAHRLAYELVRGPIPEGLALDHLCRNPGCVNPAHLEPVTIAENNHRGNGWSGRKHRQTHCVHGHVFDLANTYISKRGRRSCRRCHADCENARYHAGKRKPKRPGYVDEEAA